MNFQLTIKSFIHVSPSHFFTEICNFYHYDLERVEQENCEKLRKLKVRAWKKEHGRRSILKFFASVENPMRSHFLENFQSHRKLKIVIDPLIE